LLPPSALAVVNAMNKEQGEQVGWQQLVSAAAQGWAQIPAGDRSRAVVFTTNYGEAGAIARYGGEHGLPAPYSGHMSYADWGPPPDTANGPVLLVQYPEDRVLQRTFTGCRQITTVDNGEGVDNEEQGARIVLCDGTTQPWSQLWPSLRRFY
jgi:hypothetical protein